MKKVEDCIGIDGLKRTWAQIETLYFEKISDVGPARYKGPLQRLEELKLQFPNNPERRILNFLTQVFDLIIKSDPIWLEKMINCFNNRGFSNMIYDIHRKQLTPFGKKLEDAFRYNFFRKKVLVELANNINVKACLYCNSQYTLVVPSHKRDVAKFQFDHFFPKSRYPYLSISLYNLIPSCASCNLSKSNNVYSPKNFTHPYINDFNLLTEFYIPPKESFRMLMGEVISENDIVINMKNVSNLSVRNYISEFDLIGIYNRHKDIVKEIFYKAYAYNNGGKEALQNLKDKNGRKIFPDDHSIEQLLLANYYLAEDINKRPLSKFMQDIGKQAGLIH